MPASTKSTTWPSRIRSIRLPSAPPSRSPSAVESSALRGERAWYQAIAPMTPIDTMANSVALSRNRPNRAPVFWE